MRLRFDNDLMLGVNCGHPTVALDNAFGGGLLISTLN